MRKPAPTMSSAHPDPTIRPVPPAASCSAPPGTPRIATLADAGRIIRAKRRALDLAMLILDKRELPAVTDADSR